MYLLLHHFLTCEVLKIGFSYSFRLPTFPSTFIPLYSLLCLPSFVRASLPGGGMKVERRDREMKEAKLHCLHVGTGLKRAAIFSLLLKAQQPWIICSIETADAFSRSTSVLPKALQQIKPVDWQELKC